MVSKPRTLLRKNNYFWRMILVLLAMGLSAPVIIVFSQRTIASMHNSPGEWAPRSFEQRQRLQWFIEHFETQELVIVSWPECTLDDWRLRRFATALMYPTDPIAEKNHQRWFSRIITGYDAVQRLQQEDLGFSRDEAIKRLQGALVGPDGKTSCAVVVLSPIGHEERAQAVPAIHATACAVTGLPENEIHLAGPPVDGVFVDAEGVRSLNRYAIPSALVAFLLCYLCLRSWRLTVLIIITAAWSQGLVLSLVYFSGSPMNAVLTVLPALVFVLAVSSGVHLANYYRELVRTGSVEDAPRRALQAAWWPCLLAALTTVMGVGSLATSKIEPVFIFGVIGAIGVIATFSILLLILPGGMVLDSAAIRTSSVAARSRRRNLAVLDRLASGVASRPLLISAVFLGVMTVLGWGVKDVHTSVSTRTLFASDSKLLRDIAWLEQHLGPLTPVEVIVHFDDTCPLDLLERMVLVRRVEESLRSMDEVDGVLSAGVFFPEIPPPGGFRNTARRSALRSRLESSLPDFIESRYIAIADGEQLWRISGRAPAMDEKIDYGTTLENVQRRVEPVLREAGVPGVSATYTGVMALAYEVQRVLLADLFTSFLTAFGLVAVAMAAIQRSVLAGLVAMLPNIFPMLILFGAMGWGGIPVDIGSVMTASVALGIAVDDTLHFLAWYRRELHGGATPRDAVIRCFHHCGRAMMQTSVICSSGLLVYALSDFIPTQRFAWWMVALLMIALLGDLLLLPSLLLGPLGRFFRPQPPKLELAPTVAPGTHPAMRQVG